MTKEQIQNGIRSRFDQSSLQIMLAFLTGSVLRCLLVYFSGDSPVSSPDYSHFVHSYVMCCGKCAALIYLASFLRSGAVFVPPLIGMEGFFLWGFCRSAFHSADSVLSCALIVLSLTLFVPYSFVLGKWSVRRSLSIGTEYRNIAFPVLIVTALDLVLASFVCYLPIVLQ